MPAHLGVYAAAGLYDLAFGYRDCEAETRFLLEAFRRRRGRAASSFFELAAGPGRHALAAARAGLAVTALDLSPQMAAYTLAKAEQEGVELEYLVADMTRFEPPGTFDLAACMLCSAGYLLTDDAVIAHLSSVRAALNPDGLYVLELTHPAELGGDARSNHSWRVRDGLGELEIAWNGDPGRAIDGIWESHVTLLYRPADGTPPTRVEDVARERGFSFEEVAQFAQRSGFTVDATFGGFDAALPLADPRASRMLVVLSRG